MICFRLQKQGLERGNVAVCFDTECPEIQLGLSDGFIE